MSPAKSDPGAKDGVVAKAAGLVVLGGVAWSVYKSVGPLIFNKSKGKAGEPYEIVKGDTLFSIAQRNGVSVEALKAANGYYGDDIYAGDTITIPK